MLDWYGGCAHVWTLVASKSCHGMRVPLYLKHSTVDVNCVEKECEKATNGGHRYEPKGRGSLSAHGLALCLDYGPSEQRGPSFRDCQRNSTVERKSHESHTNDALTGP